MSTINPSLQDVFRVVDGAKDEDRFGELMEFISSLDLFYFPKWNQPLEPCTIKAIWDQKRDLYYWLKQKDLIQTFKKVSGEVVWKTPAPGRSVYPYGTLRDEEGYTINIEDLKEKSGVLTFTFKD